MKPYTLTRTVFLLMLFFLGMGSVSYLSAQSADEIITPETYFGFKPGEDGMLFDYEELVGYLKEIGQNSPRMRLVQIGLSPMGRPMYIAFISSEENISNLDQLKEINKRLALDPNISDSERESMIKNGKIFFLATLSMHSGEVAPAQAAPLIAYDLVTTKDPSVLKMLDDVVYMMVPNHNPDGMDMVVHHYRKYKGTKYEGCAMPGVYHKYVGHDNNRDFVILTQEDNKAIARIFNLDWFPQVMVEKHQMGSTGPRYFVPPMHDPIAENIDAELWSWTGVFGTNMMREMTNAGLSGVSQHYAFDDYWPGSTETCIWKNVIGMLTEMASIKYATPVYIEPNELRVRGKGLAEYKKSINMPDPWPGGWWRIGDMLQYEVVSTMAIIKTASQHRKDILTFRNDICRREVQRGQTQPPYYYVLPMKQHDSSELVGLINLLKEHGVTVYQLTSDAVLEENLFKSGDIVVPLAQPFRPFIKEVMERQEFPVRHYTPDGEIIRPYDITSWSLPLHRNVKSIEVKKRCTEFESKLKQIKDDFDLISETPGQFWAAAFSVNHNESFKAAFSGLMGGLDVGRLESDTEISGQMVPRGSFIIQNNSGMNELLEKLDVSPLFIEEQMALKTTPISMPRIALVETYFHDMDAGWTRYVFDTFELPFTVVRPGEFEKTDFAAKFDVVIFPNENKSVLMSGKRKFRNRYYLSSYPPEYSKGIGKKGMERLMTFLERGGIIVSWGESTELFMEPLEIKRGKDDIEEFQLPIRDLSEELTKGKVMCPGSLVKVLLAKDHPITLGMPDIVGVFYRGKPAFQTSVPNFDMDRRVIAQFPEKDILMSGYCENEKVLGNKTVGAWLKKGKGQLVLFGFCPQFRSSTQATFKLLFNAILLPKI